MKGAWFPSREEEMEVKFMRKNREIKMGSPAEKKLYGYLGHFKLKDLGGKEKLSFGREEIQMGRYDSRKKIKEGIGRGEAVVIDCLERNLLYFCRERMAMYLLQIDMDLGEIFGQEITGIMDIREESMRGSVISLQEADELICNYLLWLSEEKGEVEEEASVEKEDFERWIEE